MRSLPLAFALICALTTLNASGQTLGVRRAPHPPASPDQIATRMMARFDTNKDGELTQEELTPAIEFMREHRRGGAEKPAQGGTSGAGGHPIVSADKAAAHWIEKFASDKKGLTTADLAKAIAELRANRGGQPGGLGGGASQ